MSVSSTASPATSRPAVRNLDAMLVGFGAGMYVIVAGNYDVRAGENGGTGPALFTALLCVALTALLFGYVVPRVRNTERSTLTLGVLTLLSIAAFWSGATPILAAATLGAARTSARSRRRARVGLVLAALAALASVAITTAGTHLF